MADAMPPDLMTVDEVSSLAHMKRKTLLNRRARGDAPQGFRLGRTVLFHRQDVMRWLDQQRSADEVGARSA